MSVKQLFSDRPDLYCQSRPLYPDALFEYLADISPLTMRAWDCGTGNGQAALGLAKRFSHVNATDISPEQIKHQKQRENILYSVSPAERTDFPESCFDLVNVAQALHWFSLDQFWEEVTRVLRPAGIFVAYAYSWSFVSEDIDALVNQQIRMPIYDYWAVNNRLCWNGYSSIKMPFEAIKTPDFEIQTKWSWKQYADYLGTWSATQKCIDHRGRAFFDAAIEHLREIWGENRIRTVRTPLNIICGRKCV